MVASPEFGHASADALPSMRDVNSVQSRAVETHGEWVGATNSPFQWLGRSLAPCQARFMSQL